ncbi:DegT/DnrJ/EryC1/StrS family aminotransferase [Bosea sp. BK604]|uniref:DegT/DnrJ/EryC1/StrS family aminotransferase n=1 Tax=Bosea sp. BK604 TaxID=2512180 RepID=UPI0010DCD628|nr:DegT/DnrJ/EryC1/StrS family aminotransferase [Bosea sp. BK604]TCR70002.1 perosamine synthetase [Bosea sp. BK604]
MIVAVEGPTLPPDLLWTGRGTAALVALLREAAPPGSGVLVPVNLCAIAVAGIIWAGMRPVFHDVSAAHGNAEIAHLEAVDSSDCRFVLAVANFGRPIDMDAFCSFAKQRGLILVEDTCNALGASWNGQPLGSFGDAALYSFNGGKILDVGHGGAISIRDPALRGRVAAAIAEMPLADTGHLAAIAELEATLRVARQAGDEAAQRGAYARYRPQALFRVDASWPTRLAPGLDQLEADIARRRLLSARYRATIRAPGVTHAPARQGEAVWRHSLLVPPERRDALVARLRQIGLSASTWYPPVNRMFAPESRSLYPEAERFAARIVNLWVDHSTDEAMVDRTATIINNFFEQATV